MLSDFLHSLGRDVVKAQGGGEVVLHEQAVKLMCNAVQNLARKSVDEEGKLQSSIVQRVPQFENAVRKRSNDEKLQTLQQIVEKECGRRIDLEMCKWIVTFVDELWTLAIQAALSMGTGSVCAGQHLQLALFGDEELSILVDSCFDENDAHPFAASKRRLDSLLPLPFVVVSGPNIEWQSVQKLSDEHHSYLIQRLRNAAPGDVISMPGGERADGTFIVMPTASINPLWNELETRINECQRTVCFLPPIAVREGDKTAVRIGLEGSGYGVMRGDAVAAFGLRRMMQHQGIIVFPIAFNSKRVDVVFIVEDMIDGMASIDLERDLRYATIADLRINLSAAKQHVFAGKKLTLSRKDFEYGGDKLDDEEVEFTLVDSSELDDLGGCTVLSEAIGRGVAPPCIIRAALDPSFYFAIFKSSRNGEEGEEEEEEEEAFENDRVAFALLKKDAI